MNITYWVAVDGDEKHRADSEDAAHSWALANLRAATSYTVIRVGPSDVGVAQEELFRTPDASN